MAFAKTPVRPSRLGDVIGVDGNDHDVGCADQGIEFAPTRLALPGLDDEGGLKQGGGLHHASRIVLHEGPKVCGV